MQFHTIKFYKIFLTTVNCIYKVVDKIQQLVVKTLRFVKIITVLTILKRCIMKKTVIHATSNTNFIKLINLLQVANIRYEVIENTNSLYIFYQDIPQSKIIYLTILLNDFITQTSLKKLVTVYK